MGVETGAPEGASAAELDQLRRRVLNVVGHELRTPVTTLSGLVAELASVDDGPVREQLLAAVVRSAARLDRLVEDLLLASSIETLVPVGTPEPVDLLAAAKKAWKVAGEDRPPATFAGEGSASARPAVVERVLAALLDNAAVHGEPPVVVTVSTIEDRAVLEVASGGPMLSAEDLRLACEPFYRGERAVTTRAGLGLGLALARTLARADGGEVSLRRNGDAGVIARLELPSA